MTDQQTLTPLTSALPDDVVKAIDNVCVEAHFARDDDDDYGWRNAPDLVAARAHLDATIAAHMRGGVPEAQRQAAIEALTPMSVGIGAMKRLVAEEMTDAVIKALDAAPSPAEPQTQAARDVLAERRRQVEAEGWTAKHDNEHDEGEMGAAAACYALAGVGQMVPLNVAWPWARGWWKPKGGRRDLVEAGALILAEIERLDRITPPGPVRPAPPAEQGDA